MVKKQVDKMLEAIIGDIAGARFEWNNIKTKGFEFFTDRCHVTDDSIMSLAVAKSINYPRDDLSKNDKLSQG